MSVVPLKTERAASNEAAVEMLEKALAEAKDGEIIAVGIAVVRPGGHVNCGHTSFDCAGMLLGATALLQSRLIANMEPS